MWCYCKCLWFLLLLSLVSSCSFRRGLPPSSIILSHSPYCCYRKFTFVLIWISALGVAVDRRLEAARVHARSAWLPRQQHVTNQPGHQVRGDVLQTSVWHSATHARSVDSCIIAGECYADIFRQEIESTMWSRNSRTMVRGTLCLKQFFSKKSFFS